MQWQIEYARTTHNSTVEHAACILIQPRRCKEAHRFVDATPNTPHILDGLAKHTLCVLRAILAGFYLVHPHFPCACPLLDVVARLARIVVRVHRPARQLRENAVLHFL